MDPSEIRFKISSFCLTFSGFPRDTADNPERIVRNVKGAHNAQLIRTATGDEKWLILFSSINDVEEYLRNPQTNVKFDEVIYLVKVERSVPCDIPEEWNNQEVLNQLQQSGQGQVPSQSYLYPNPQNIQPGQGQGHIPFQTNQYPQVQDFQHAYQGGIPTQGQPGQMYSGPHQNPYAPHQLQYPFSPMPGQGHYQNVQQTQNKDQYPGFQQPQYPHQGGPMFYGDPRYYNMYGNYWGLNPQGPNPHYAGQRPPPPPYSTSEQQNSPQQMNATDTAQHDSSTHMHHAQMPSTAPEEDTGQQSQLSTTVPHEGTIPKSQMSPIASDEGSIPQSAIPSTAPQETTTQQTPYPIGPYDFPTPQDKSTENSADILQRHESYPHISQQHIQYPPMTMPMPSAPWEVSTEGERIAGKEAHKDRKVDSEPEKTAMIKVSNLPHNTTEDSLTFFFENRRVTGGGSIEEVDFDDSDYTAIITFEDPDAVERILQKLPLLFQNKQIEVEAFYPGGREGEYQDDELNNSHDNDEDDDDGGHYSACTIEVHGVKNTTTDDTVEFYFENTKRSGGGDIKSMKREEKVIFITFVDEKAVERVLAQGNHKIDDIKLEVKQYIPPPPPKPRIMYEDKIFITGMNPDTTEDCLSNFLEAKTSISPSEIIYGEEEGTALVTFEEKPDFDKLISVCKKRALEKHYLSISRVPVTNCILVSGFGDKTSKDTLEFYFENKRSGGGEIEKVEKNEDDNTCLVYFSDISVLDNVCKKSHSIDGQTLNVRIYHECLGQVDIDDEQETNSGPSIPVRTPKFKVPDPMTISDIHLKKLEFLQNSEAVKTGVEKQMSSCHATVEWPTTKHDPLKIACTLSTDVKDYKKLAKSWKKSATEILDRFLNTISIEKIDILQEAWDLVLQGLKSLTVAHPDGVTVSIDQTTTEIFIVGYSSIIGQVYKQVKKIVAEVTTELDRKKKQVTETIKIDKPFQLRILRLNQFPNKMADKLQGLKVKINIKKNEIIFEGMTGDITQAKLDMYVLFQNIVSTKVGKFSDEKLKFLESVSVKEHISTNLREAEVNAVWDIDAQQNVIMYALSDDDKVKGAHVLKDAIVETPISLKEEALCLLQSQKWQMAKSDIENRAPGLINIIPEADKSRVLIYTVSKHAGEVREKMEDFLHDNTIYEKQMSGPPGKMRFLLQYYKVNIEKIAKELEEHQVTIIMDKVKIGIKGTSQGLHQAMTKIDDIVDMVKQKTHLMEKSNIAKHLLSDAGRESMNRVEKAKMCVIESEPCYSSSSHDDDYVVIGNIDRSENQDLATCVTSDGQRIMVRKGDITELDVDVLVNAANKDLQHLGGLAKIIVSKGGMSIQEECNRFIRKNHGALYEGDVYCSAPGNLKCKLIVHAVGPIWQGGHQNEPELLREVVYKSLEESEKKCHKSIAIPALCSGIFGYPVGKATKVIAESIRDFFQNIQPVYIKDVFLCDINEDNVEEFIKGLIKAFGRDNVQQQNRGQKGSAWITPSTGNKRAGKSADIRRGRGPVTKLCKINIRIVKGQIARQKVDVIVNTTAQNLKLSQGAVSASVLKTGGQSLQNEISSKYPNGIQFGDVAETSGGNLQCSKVFHGSMPQWDGSGMALDMLKTFMNNCLTLVSQYGLESVAFPALGTGNLAFPKDVVAKEMFQCVIDYSSNQPSSSVADVMFVLYDKDTQTVQAFEDEESRRHGDTESDDGAGHSSRKGRQFGSNVNPVQHGGHQPRRQPQQQGRHGSHGNQQGAGDGVQVITVGKLQLKVYQDDITKARADVIVNSTNSEFDLSRGAVAQAILQKGGAEMRNQIKLNSEKMKSKGIVTTTAGKGMPASYIIHVNAEDKRKSWKDKIIKILEKSEKLKVSTVAFPALGTGLGTKIEEVADSLFDALVEFQNSQFQSLSEIHMVIFQSQMMTSFIDQMKTCVNTKGKKSKGIIATIGNWFGFTSNDSKNGNKTPDGGEGEGDYTSENQSQNSQELVSVKLKIYANKKETLDAAKDMIEAECENSMKTKLFEDKIIREFSQEEEEAVHEIGEVYGVEINLERRIGRLRLTGLLQDLMHATDAIYNIIRQAERKKQLHQEAKLYAQFVKWHFIEVTEDGNQLEEYPNAINLKLETAYKNQDNNVKFCDSDGREYTVDLNKLIEYPTDDPRDKVTVIRKDLVKDSTFEPPASWATMQDSENISVIDIKPGSPEYQTVITNFQQQLSQHSLQVNIIKCERIQNRSLYQQYVAKKKSIDAQNPSTVVNEKMLWHGTAGNAVDSINAYGFNRSYCGKNAVVHGNGVYFAAHAAYSCRTTYSPPDPNTGQRHIYQCKVLTGEFAQGQQGMRVPPNKPSTTAAASHILYDSVVDNVQNPGIFVIFNDTQAYPEYHIIFA